MLLWLELAALTARAQEDAFEDAFNAIVEPIMEAYWAYEYRRAIRGY